MVLQRLLLMTLTFKVFFAALDARSSAALASAFSLNSLARETSSQPPRQFDLPQPQSRRTAGSTAAWLAPCAHLTGGDINIESAEGVWPICGQNLQHVAKGKEQSAKRLALSAKGKR
jgi:hypothetical protein